ncbi:hypothetical protein CABS03_05843 [Colletotrichum abscissum]|uniref:GPI inositol-deacylase n=1 Tax=Colletotrichum abscissum TaxID=1671311 RepID=A0A9P9WZN2_9PEZI|nr:hypothetical protein CABS02_15165 [Colletotrichum abscissum]
MFSSYQLAGITAEPPSLSRNLGSDETRVRAPSFGPLQHRLRKLSTRLSRSSRSDSSCSIQSLSAADIKGALGLNLLHAPSEPAIDFVFIHGLGGGSRKTWSHSADIGMFWPRDWLPNEAGFKHVRIHSFGYNSDWTTRKDSRLTVHDFGQALLADLHNSPCLRKNGDTPIVFISHSMGGLVAKKAYLIATRDPNYETIGKRIHTMLFLGTPHRGADSASVARLVRQSAGYGSKAFLDDLIPGSGTLDQINDEFRHICHNINLWSFFESLPTSFGPTSSLIVEKESAVLGLPREHVQYLEADHRQMCKFDSPSNPNYLTLQRAFKTIVEEIGTVSEPILDSDRFQKWIDGPIGHWADKESLSEPSRDLESKRLWLNGRPGTGKTIAAGHVIRHLQSRNLDCSFFFFRHEETSSSTLALLMRSLAFQIADSNFEVRQALASMAEDNRTLKFEDHYLLWATLFNECIFKAKFDRPQFWVIDAIDECSSEDLPGLISMLSHMEQTLPIRVLVTSRPGGQVRRYLTLERTDFVEIVTGEEGSLRDIEVFVEAMFLQTYDADQYDGIQNLVADVLTKADGNFLWTSLTVARLENAYSVEDKQDVLRQIPPQMDELYSRTLDLISQSPSAELAECVLKWAICSPKSLHINELAEAVKLDVGKTLAANGWELESMTGHLIVVDGQSYIRVAHLTTSAFLSQERDKGFWIDTGKAHSEIAETCLDLLCSSNFAPPRTHRGVAAARMPSLSPLSEYAALSFPYHLAQASSATGSSLLLLAKFFTTNVLTWIQRTATAGNLWTLQLTAQRLKTYLGRLARCQSPTSTEFHTIATWANDIYRILAVFHSILLTSPSSIHFLIPHFCPPKSMIGQIFAKSTKRLRIAGPREEDWNDRLTGYIFSEEAYAIACCTRLLAVGLASGEIRLFHLAGSGAFDAAATLNHGKRVRLLAFNRASSVLVSCSSRNLQIWDTHRSPEPIRLSPVWSRTIDFTPGSISFDHDEEMIILSNPHGTSLVIYDIKDGKEAERKLLHAPSVWDSDSSDENDNKLGLWTPAMQIRLDSDHKLATLSYRHASVSIWDLNTCVCVGNFEKDNFNYVYATSQVLDMVFNPIAEVELLAISYMDGDVVTCNPWTQDQANKYHLQTLLSALSTSSDGRVLVGAAEDGGIYLFLFETLQPIYHIQLPGDQLRIKDIAFSADNLRFYDIRGQCCNVWEPIILLSKEEYDDDFLEISCSREEVSLPEIKASRSHVYQWGESITAIEPANDMLLVGRQDGTIDVSDLTTGEMVEKLRIHDAFAEIKSLDWNEDTCTLLSIDTTWRHIVTRVTSLGSGPGAQLTCLLNRRGDSDTSQIILSPKTESLLVCTHSSATLIALNGTVMGEEKDLKGAWWLKHPSNSSHLLAFRDNHFHIYEWCNLKRVCKGINLSPSPQIQVTKGCPSWISSKGSGYLAQGLFNATELTSGIIAVEASKITPSTEVIPTRSLHITSTSLQSVIGCIKSSLLFLDTAGWICSTSLNYMADAQHFTRHFFIPLTWRSEADAVIKIVSKTAIAFGRGEHLMIFHGFLEFEERIPI